MNIGIGQNMDNLSIFHFAINVSIDLYKVLWRKMSQEIFRNNWPNWEETCPYIKNNKSSLLGTQGFRVQKIIGSQGK